MYVTNRARVLPPNYSVWFKEHCPEHLIANGRYRDSLNKVVHFDQFQKQIPKRTERLPQYIDIVHAVGQELLFIAENFVFLHIIPFQNFCSLIARHVVCSIDLDFGIRTDIFQMVGRVKEVRIIPVLAWEIKLSGHAFRLIG